MIGVVRPAAPAPAPAPSEAPARSSDTTTPGPPQALATAVIPFLATPGAGRALVAAVVVLIAALSGGCGRSADGECGPVRREPLDSRAFHVLPGADDPTYRTDPQTSGPHVASPAPPAVATEPIRPPVQVGLLEEGAVLIQHRGLDADERDAVEALGGDGVVVAPAESLPEGAVVVATAWVTKQVCTGVDVEALRSFARDHQGSGPSGHG